MSKLIVISQDALVYEDLAYLANLPNYKRLLDACAQIKTLVETENRRYVSDGDPNTIAVPAALKDDLAPDKTQGKEVKIY